MTSTCFYLQCLVIFFYHGGKQKDLQIPRLSNYLSNWRRVGHLATNETWTHVSNFQNHQVENGYFI